MRTSNYYLITIGVVLLSFVTESILPVFVIPLCLLAWYSIFNLLGSEKSFEWTAFSIMFSLLVFIMGISQTYALLNFDELQTTIDAHSYFKFSISKIPLRPIEELGGLTNAPLPTKVWSLIYQFFSELRVATTPWMGILLNTILVAVSASITVGTGRMIFGHSYKLNYILRFFMFSGLLWIFGSLHLRGAFALVINTLILYGVVLVWKTHKTKATVAGLFIVLGTSWVMRYVRIEFVPVMILLSSSIPIILLFSKVVSKPLKVLILPILIIVLAINYNAIINFGTSIIEQNTSLRESYIDLDLKSREGGVGRKILLNQPIIVRGVLGSIHLFFQPMPVWIGFSLQSSEYYWMKSLNGIFLYVLAVMILHSTLGTAKQVIKGEYNVVDLFLLAYLVATTLVISLTSLEFRHHGQFYAGYFLLATGCNLPKVKIIGQAVILFLLMHLIYFAIKTIS